MADRPARPRRRRRILVRLAIALLALLTLVWFAPLIVAKTGLRQTALAHAAGELNGTVTADEASFGWLSPVELRGVAVADAAGRPALRADRVTSSKTLLQLLTDRSDLGTFTVERPALEVVCEPDTTNVEQLIAKFLADDGAPGAERAGVALKVLGGRVVVKEAGQDGERAIDPVDVTVTVPQPRTEPITVTVSAGAPGAGGAGKLEAELTLGERGEAVVTADGFALDRLDPLARRFVPGLSVAGRLTAERLAVRWGGDSAAVDGRVEVAGLEIAAPWLGPDRVRLQRAALPCKLTLAGGELRVEKADLACDVGTASFAGVVNPEEPAGKLLARPGLRLDADIDAAKLAAVLPRLLRVKEGTELREGRLTVHLHSEAGPSRTEWAGTVQTTALRGTRDGKPIAWEQPLRAAFAGRLRADGVPVFDKFECQSDFVGLAARGSPEEFVAAANLNLDRLSARLAEFVDLGVRLEGTAAVMVRSGPRPGGGFAAEGSVKLARFALTDSTGRGLREPELTLTAKASGRLDPGGAVALDGGELGVLAGADAFAAVIAEPIADVRAARSGKLSVRLSGDLGRWRGRLGGWLGIPPGWEIGGTGTVAGVVRLTVDGLASERLTADVANARFRGAGVDLVEPALRADAGLSWDRKTGSGSLGDVHLSCETLTLSSPRLDVKPAADGGYGLAGTAAVTGNVNRLQRALHLGDPGGSDALGGLARGSVTFDVAARPLTFDANLTVERFSYGPPAKPTWSEPSVPVSATGDYDLAADAVRFRSLKVGRDGFTVDAKGSVAKATTAQELALDGTLAYDLSRLEPVLRAYLGKSVQVAGQGSRPFQLTGRLADGLGGHAAVAWQSVRAYGFEVGPAELRATLDRGAVKVSPVEAAFGGGKVRLEPSLDLNSKTCDLSFARGRVVERARLTPAACADALGYALPAVANAAQADGLVSLDLDDNRIPLADPDRAVVRGKLIVHTATVSPGPVISEVVNLLGVKPTAATLATEQVVPVRLENGRVHHENFAVALGQSVVHTSGSVGLDGSLALVLDVPVPPRALDRVKAGPIRDALAKQRLKVPLAGTLHKPQLDAKAFEAAVEALVRSAAKSAADELLKQGQQKLLDEIQKKLGPKK